MTSDVIAGSERSLFEDPLTYLPRSPIKKYAKGQVIYDSDGPNSELHLVIEGYVKVTRMAGTGEIVMIICQVDDLFGESVFVQSAPGERAVAIEASQIMSWPSQVIRDLILRHPPLGIAFIQWLACRCSDLGERIATLSTDSTARRLAKALLHLAERLGQEEDRSNEAKRLSPFSHKLLAQYIGTTREAVTHCMNQFRREGFVTYSRRDMMVYCEALRQWLGGDVKPTPSACLPLSEQNGHDPGHETLSM